MGIRVALVADAASYNVRDWARGLVGAGAEVDLVSFVDDPEGELPVHRLSAPTWAGARARYLAAGPAVRRIMDRIDPDVVVGFYVTGYGTVARLARRMPLVEVSVGNDTLVNPPGTMTHLLARQNLRRARLVVAWAPHIAQAVAGFGVPDERILSLTGGIPLEAYDPARNPLDDPTRLVTTRALDPYYRHDLLIGAVADAPDLGLRLRFIGTGPIRGELEGQVRSLGLEDRVTFAGSVPSQVKVDDLYAHGVYVSACPTDGVSASLLEAMAVGLFPVVVDHVANRSWIVDGENGYLVDGSQAGFVGALRRLTADPTVMVRARDLNRNLVRDRGDLRTNSTRFVEQFTLLAGAG